MPRGPLAVRSRLGHHPTRPQQLRTSERLDRTQEVGGSSPPSSISRTRAVEPNAASRARRGLWPKRPGVKQESSILFDPSSGGAGFAPLGRLTWLGDRAHLGIHALTVWA